MGKKGLVLLVDDDEDVLLTSKMILRPHFEKILTESSPKKLESILSTSNPDVIILDMNYKTGATTGNEGLFWLRKIQEIDDSIKVIMNTAYGDIQLAVECMKEGAADFITKPWEKEKILNTVLNVYKLRVSEKEVSKLESAQKVLVTDLNRSENPIIGNSEAMKKVFDLIDKVAATDANVLITGENGTGKELIAKAIHKKSKRNNRPFIKADLGALSANLFESELFGYKKGAFTDAKEDRPGRITIADKGTLFLDEIGNISEAQQTKLLSVLQNREVIPLGGHSPTPIDIRIVSATNKNISKAVDNGSFRMDLLYRLNTIEIHIPALRDRKADIPLLVDHYLTKFTSKYDKPILYTTDDCLKKLQEYHWPGNIRELEHAVERAVIMASGKELQSEDFMLTNAKKPESNDSLKVEDVEKDLILQAIDKHKGNLSKASEELGMGRSTLYRKMERYKIK
ncbi:sigma-54-dependent transcriptional regulator [Fulvivirga lutea]|uniref:Sigma-54-dependent Fis family transcriptional regulator n=1 Tax=Fulvivirga lutea TaxID=2810512 RepID=A0A975A0L5_9BACT|nr:sigma-54 dependent transcriptional regulator [Fulvivirga lutea]QSE96567.1 sigma-54-dependent Fis family transcriptional regulator [Fulvivirga lutea]